MIKKLFQIKRLKCGPAEVEFFGDVTLPEKRAGAASVKVSITQHAKEDAKRSRLSRKRILEQLKYTLHRHERLLSGSFVSMPLHILGHVAMVSYTVKEGLAIERILPAAKKTPLYESWAGLLSLYRRVAGLSYRINEPSVLLQDHQARRTVRALASLCIKCETYIVLYHRCHPHMQATWDQHSMELLMTELEFFLNDGDVEGAVARIEILLSNAHRMILSCAPTTSVADAVSQLTESEFQSPPKRANRRVLLVEDDDIVRQFLQHILEVAGLTVEPASDGDTALNLLLTKSYELIVTDVVMPGMSGTEVVRIAKVFNAEQLSIGCSGYFSGDDDEVASVFTKYYQKPFKAEVIGTEALNLIERKHVSSAEQGS